MTRNNFDYDLVIIGGGSAGIVAGNVAGGLGARVALVEKSRIGGECLWTGCVPSKALLHAADVAWTVRTARGDLGLNADPLTRSDADAVFAAVRRKIETVRVNDASETMLRDFGVEIFFGESRFVGPNLLRTPQGDLRGANFLIATGSSPVVPSIPGLSDTGFRTNQTLFDLDRVPESVVCIGGGYISLEMGQALNRLGARVTILDRGPRLLENEDAELAEMLVDALRAEGVTIVTDVEITCVRSEKSGKVVETSKGAFACAEILVAAGRRANTGGLGLDSVGVALDAKGNVAADPDGRTTVRHIWACGDVTGQNQFSHMAEHEAKVLVRNILFPGSQAVPLRVVPWATFTDPEYARVGLTEEQARAKFGDDLQVLRHEFRQDDRAIVDDQAIGLVKVLAVGLNGTVVGAHILGPRAGELIHEWVIAMRHNLPVRAIADLIHVYPTLSVSNQRAAQRWYAGVLDQPIVQGALGAFGLSPRDAGGI